MKRIVMLEEPYDFVPVIRMLLIYLSGLRTDTLAVPVTFRVTASESAIFQAALKDSTN